MPLSVPDIYQKLLPKTNCGDCGHSTCLAFASMVVSEKIPLANCPHIDRARLPSAQQQIDAQHAAGKWTRRDMAADALQWAKERAASMDLADLPERIGGRLVENKGQQRLELPYFTATIVITPDAISRKDGEPLNRWEQVFIYNHLAQGGRRHPTGNWKGLVELPNTVSKMKSMRSNVEVPLIHHFAGRSSELIAAGRSIGGEVIQDTDAGADVRLLFRPLPRIPVMVQFWDADSQEAFGAEVKFLFDETITEHLDIESILFLSERLMQLLCDKKD